MAISFVGAASAASASVILPAHQAGDLIIVFAYRDGSNTAPSLPGAPSYTNLQSGGGNTNSARIGFRVATSSAEVTGTWTNATEIVALIYRGAAAGAVSSVGGGNSATISYPALSLSDASGTSWVLGAAGHRTATNVGVAPAGMQNRTTVNTAAGHETQGGVGSWGAQNLSVNASSGWRAVVLELLDDARAADLSEIDVEDTLTANGSSAVAGTVSRSDAADSLEGGVLVDAGLREGVLQVDEAGESLAAAAAVEVAGGVSGSSGADALAAAAGLESGGEILGAEVSDLVVAVVTVVVGGGLDLTTAPDSLGATAQTIAPAMATGAVAEVADAGLSMGAVIDCGWNRPHRGASSWRTQVGGTDRWASVGDSPVSWGGLAPGPSLWSAASDAPQHWVFACMALQFEQGGFLSLEDCEGLTLDMAA